MIKRFHYANSNNILYQKFIFIIIFISVTTHVRICHFHFSLTDVSTSLCLLISIHLFCFLQKNIILGFSNFFFLKTSGWIDTGQFNEENGLMFKKNGKLKRECNFTSKWQNYQ